MVTDLMGEDDWEGAWQLSGQLEHDLSCLQGVPTPAQLGRFRLVQAQLARLGEEEGTAGGDVSVSLKRAAAVGEAEEEGIDPDILSEVAALKHRLPEPLRVAVTGTNAGSFRLDGRSPVDGVLEVIPGEHRIWVGERSETLSVSQPTVFWVGGVPGTFVEALAELPKRAPTPSQQMLLLAAAKVVDQPMVYLGVQGRRVDLWKPMLNPEGEVLIRWMPQSHPSEFGGDQVDSWRAVYGVGLGGGWSNQRVLEGAGGSPGLYARWRLNDRLQAAFSAFPLLQPSESGFAAIAPFRLGLRYGRQTSAWTADFGLDAGLEWLGAFDPRATGFLLGGAAGASGAIGPKTGLRFEVWGGAGLDHGVFGLWIGVEGRLRARALLTGGAG
jgi:hypothetical protein